MFIWQGKFFIPILSREMKLSFNGMSNIIFGQTYYEREDRGTLFPHPILEEANPFFKKWDLVSTHSPSCGGTRETPH